MVEKSISRTVEVKTTYILKMSDIQAAIIAYLVNRYPEAKDASTHDIDYTHEAYGEIDGAIVTLVKTEHSNE